VGFAAAQLERHFAGPLDAYLGELVVHRDAEGRGAGRKLVAAVEHWARAAGARFVTLETGAANTRARGFYAALGYAEEQVRLTRRL
jgi:ribosomal protein S18 acetylase RimI-like enzyme